MRILFAGKQHFEIGGIDRNTEQLARRLVARGHDVGVVAAPRISSWQASTHRPVGVERFGTEYPQWAIVGLSPAHGLGEVLAEFNPDVVVVNAGGQWSHDWTRPLLRRAASRVPTVLYIHDRQAVPLVGDPALRPHAIWACADTHAAGVRALGRDVTTVSPLVEPDLYRVEPAGEAVLFVNPVKEKGVRIAITLAAMRRDIPFIFLRSWRLHPHQQRELEGLVGQLGNVEMAAAAADPRPYYRRARLLLAPYDDNSRPRVVTEAQLSGIPVLAYDDDGFREAAGEGAILVPRDAPMYAWLSGLSRLWDDDVEHHRVSQAALAHSRRADADPARIIELVESSLRDAITAFRTRRAEPDEPVAADPAGPLVSVVIPVRNGAGTIDEQLAALARQTYAGRWELLVSDNGSTDGTRGRVMAWQGGIDAPIRIIDASRRRGVAHARNAGIRAARGELILICDADDVVSPTWIEAMVAALAEFDIVTGRGEQRLLNTPDQYEWMGDVDQHEADDGYNHLPFAAGGNLGVRKEVALALAGFDETLLRAEDIDWSWRAHYAGYRVGFVRDAVIHYRYRREPAAVAKTWFRAGMAEPLLYRRHRDHGMRVEPSDQVAAEWRWLWRNAGAALRTPELQHRWTANAARRAGRLVGSVVHRAWFP